MGRTVRVSHVVPLQGGGADDEQSGRNSSAIGDDCDQRFWADDHPHPVEYLVRHLLFYRGNTDGCSAVDCMQTRSAEVIAVNNCTSFSATNTYRV